MAIQASILAIELDLHLAEWLVAQDLPINEENMLAAYRTVDEAGARRTQINNLKDVCYRTDKYLNSFMLKRPLPLLKAPLIDITISRYTTSLMQASLL